MRWSCTSGQRIYLDGIYTRRFDLAVPYFAGARRVVIYNQLIKFDGFDPDEPSRITLFQLQIVDCFNFCFPCEELGWLFGRHYLCYDGCKESSFLLRLWTLEIAPADEVIP